MKNVNFRRAAQKTEGRADRLHKKEVRLAIEKGGVGCRKGQPSGPPFSTAQLNVQPTGPSCSAVWRPALLCISPARGKFVFHLATRPSSPPGPPVLRLVLSCPNSSPIACPHHLCYVDVYCVFLFFFIIFFGCFFCCFIFLYLSCVLVTCVHMRSSGFLIGFSWHDFAFIATFDY